MALASIAIVSIAVSVQAVAPREWNFRSTKEVVLEDLDIAPTPEETCSLLDYYCSFGRVSKIIWKGLGKSIGMADLPDLPWHYDPEILRLRFTELRQQHKSTGKALLMLVWREVCLTFLYAGLFFAAELILPFGFYQLLEYMRKPEEAMIEPYAWLFVMFAGQMLRSIIQQQYSFTSTRMGMKLKIALTAELYKVALSSRAVVDPNESSLISRKISNAGHLSNLISIDVNTIVNSRVLLMVIAGIPMGCIVSLIALYSVVSWPCLVGLAIMFLGSLVTTWLVNRSEDLQEDLQTVQDSRISIASEYLRSIRVVKYFGWEDTVIDRLSEARAEEEDHLWHIGLLLTLVSQTAYCIPASALVTIFGLYVNFDNRPLTASVSYTTIYLLELIRDNFAAISMMGFHFPKLRVSLRRLDKYFATRSSLEVYPEGPLYMDSATFRRNENADFRLSNVTIQFTIGGLNTVTGLSGNGKTTLLLAILGETAREKGEIRRPKDIAYASQSPWLQALSIRDNILFESAYDAEKYQAIIKACCLDVDIEDFPSRDMTIVGDNGATLSGGQCARVALARVLCSKASVLLLDDVLSAIDTKTALTIWNRTFCSGILVNRTVVLVTQLSWLPREADLSIHLENGRVKNIRHGIGHARKPKLIHSEPDVTNLTNILQKSDAGVSIKADKDIVATDDGMEQTDVDREAALPGISNRLSFLDYISYFGSPLIVSFTILTLVTSNCAGMATTLWMTHWVDAVDHDSAIDTMFYLGLYMIISIISTASEGLAVFSFMRGSWVAAKGLHSELITSLMSVSLSWFNGNSTGRLINRLSSDVDSLDQSVVEPLTEFLDQAVNSVLLIGTISSIMPVFLLPAAVISVLGAVFGEVYSRTAVFMKRLVSSSQSPILSQISESLDGLTIIQGRSGMSRIFSKKLDQLLYSFARATAAQNECDQWLKFRITTFAALINVTAGLLALSQRHKLSAGLVGFSLTQASALSGAVLSLIFKLNDLSIELQSFSRISDYCKFLSEEVSKKEIIANISENAERCVPANWLTSGCIEFRDVTVRYSERIAIVGRTGSGKSTLILSLLRFTYIVSGEILYDDVNITTIPRRRLRQAIATIPQEALLFQGTIGSNLATGTMSETRLQEALDVGTSAAPRTVKEYVASSDGNKEGNSKPQFYDMSKLSTLVEAKGNNFSHGQRQVISLCRVLARKSKLMLLDEATSNTGLETDAGIQQALQQEMSGHDDQQRCLIAIAHRLRTIQTYDKVVVLASGQVVEMGSPSKLMANKGIFHDMVLNGDD